MQQQDASGGQKEPLLELNTLWIGSSLPPLQRLCLASAVATGCRTRLFVYEPIEGIPAGVEIADGREVLGLDKMIRHRKSQGVALFSDRLRYEVLGKNLGAWFDTDMLFLKAPEMQEECLVGWENDKLISAGFIYLRHGHSLIDDLRRHANDEYPVPGWYPFWHKTYLELRQWMKWPKHVSDLHWGVIGPNLLTWLLKENGMTGFAKPVVWSCPLPYSERHALAKGGYDWRKWTTPETVCIHLWNHGLSRETRFAKPEAGSLLADMADKCGFAGPDSDSWQTCKKPALELP